MAGQILHINGGNITLPASARTALQVKAPQHIRLRVRKVGIFTRGTATAVPLLAQLIRQSDAGTTGSTVTPIKADSSNGETVQTTALANPTGGEPTTASNGVVKTFAVPVREGMYEMPLDDGEIEIPGDGRLGLVLTAGAAVDVVAYLVVEE